MNRITPHFSYYRWVMLAGISLLYSCFAMVHFSTSALATIMIEDLGLSLSEMGSIMGAWPLAYIFLAIPVGILLDRFGIRYMLLFGIVVIALSAYLRVIATNQQQLFFALLTFGFGAPFISIGMPTIVRKWFSYEQRGLAMGICAAMIAVGSVMGLTLTSELLRIFDGSWRCTLNVYAWGCVVVALIWALIISHPICRQNDQREGLESIAEVGGACIRLLGNASIRSMLVLSIGAFFYMHATINWLPKLILQFESEISLAEAVSWASLPVIVGIFSSALVHKFTSNNREILVMTLLFVISSISSILLAAGAGTVILFITLAMVGIVRGALPVVSLMLMMHMPGISQKNTGSAMGLLFGIGQIGGVTGPLIVGYLAQKSDGFYLSLYFLAGLCLFLAGLSLVLGRISAVEK